MPINFCIECGGNVTLCEVTGETLHRYVCTQCDFIHYQNPKVVTGCLVYKNDKVLLCKRAIEPRIGLWTVPAGFMENSESTRAAAQRETIEEAGAKVELKELFLLANLTQSNQVYILYLAELQNTQFSPGTESCEVELFSKSEVPWDDIAFHTVKLALTKFFEDLESRCFVLHEIDFD